MIALTVEELLNGVRKMDKMIALNVFHLFEGRGVPAGNFGEQMIRTVAAADKNNQAKLAMVFPEYVFAVRAYKNSEDSYNALEKLAFGE